MHTTPSPLDPATVLRNRRRRLTRDALTTSPPAKSYSVLRHTTTTPTN